ncbi:MAG TPA: heparinase II/III family protein, partial [Chloroflexota bacterium]|nr:heparinase II/III family protein [Chloroflexota bacterium]
AALAVPAEDALLSGLRQEHPRLLLLPDDVARLQGVIAGDATARGYRDALLRSGERTLGEPVSQRVLVGPRLLDTSRRVLERIYTLGLLFRLDGDARWRDRAMSELRAAAAFPDWNPSHFLDVAEMSHAFAIGYDWLHGALTAEEQATIRDALIEKGLHPAADAYAARAWWAADSFNWNNVCNGGIATAALALADEEPDLCRPLLARALKGLPKALASYAPDGAWSEGPGYWGYATKYTVLTLAALQSALGSDFGLSTLPGLSQTGLFRLHSAGPAGHFFNFADAGERAGDEPSLFWLSRRYDSPVLALAGREAAGSAGSARDLLWYESRGSRDDLSRTGLDARYTAAHVAFFRSAWSDPRALYVGFKGGDNKANHSHLDLGTFVLDALGQRWAMDLGPDDYNLPGYFESPRSPSSRRWTYYRLRTEGHNTLTLDGQNQDPLATAPLIAFGSASGGAFAVADLSAAYRPAGARRVQRGVALRDDRSRVLVQDEVESEKPLAVRWAMHTRADVRIVGEGGGRGDRAVLSLGGAQLEVRLLAPGTARFTVGSVQVSLPQRPAPNVHVLEARVEGGTSARLAVLFTPLSAGAATPTPALAPAPTLTPLERWRA